MDRSRRTGFTLVELLVVITIIGILVALSLRAVHRARESALRATCKNNLYQMGRAVSQHLERHGFFPTGGWGWGWAGDPDRGFTRRQPAGWGYNILPYLELSPLHDMGAGLPDASKKTALTAATSTPVATYHCPSRRRAIAYPYIHGSPYYNLNYTAGGAPGQVIGRTDYAICAGDMRPGSIAKGPSTLGAGDGMADWGADAKSNGVSYLHSEVTTAMVRDGLSNTYLIGERYVNPDGYFTGQPADDDQGWNLGWDWDTVRWGRQDTLPIRDRPGYGNVYLFGSAHDAGWNMVFCDGAVRTMSYTIDPDIHRNLAVRNDGNPIDQSRAFPP